MDWVVLVYLDLRFYFVRLFQYLSFGHQSFRDFREIGALNYLSHTVAIKITWNAKMNIT